MAIVDIVLYPDKILETYTRYVDQKEIGSQEILSLITNLKDTCIAHNAAGLSANQIGSDKAIFVYTKKKGQCKKLSDLEVVINPTMIAASGNVTSRGEGCLSIPDHTFDVKRHKTVVMQYIDQDGNKQRMKAKTNFMSKLFQHELDHLHGITLIERYDR
jgi:peptide deformylase